LFKRDPNDLSVKFGKHARTIEYNDAQAHILFTFDISGPHSMTLEHHTPTTPRDPRYGIAFERVKHFLEGKRTEVNVYGE